jgi:pimeloyl-ACP methyl ester carboxylesterase
MKRIWIWALLAIACADVRAQDDAKTQAWTQARAIVADLDKIVAPHGVQESYKTRIGGVDQWLTVRGQERDNPMILFVHGGPAAPVTPTLWQFERPLEEYFTIANWDQRGAGKSYGETDPAQVADTIRIDRYVDDAIEVAEHLRQRYGKKKLILMGHSWGTIVSMKAALKRPDLFYAYVGIGQVISVRENERISFDYALAQAKITRTRKRCAICLDRALPRQPADHARTHHRGAQVAAVLRRFERLPQQVGLLLRRPAPLAGI